MLIITESILLALSCCIDAFTASFAYGSKNIKIPFLSNQIINLVCCTILGISLWLGSVIKGFLPGWLTLTICFISLFTIGLIKLTDGITKSMIRKHNKINKDILRKEIKFSLFNFSFILSLYANPEEADIDENKVISPLEAVILAVSLSLDGIAAGFGAAMSDINIQTVCFVSFAANMAAIYLGCRVGMGVAKKMPFDVSWLGGAMLMTLALTKVF